MLSKSIKQKTTCIGMITYSFFTFHININEIENTFIVPVGRLFFNEFPVEDTAEEAEDAVMVGGEGDEEN